MKRGVERDCIKIYVRPFENRLPRAPSEDVHAILGLFEGEINIYEKETKEGLEGSLRVKKMYNQRYLDSELPLRKEKLGR